MKKEGLCKIVMKDNMQYLVSPDGKILPMQVWTRVTQVLTEQPYAIVKIIVNLDDTVPDTTEWQLCPKCKGTGLIPGEIGMASLGPIISSYDTCHLCNGKKILSKVTGEPPQ